MRKIGAYVQVTSDPDIRAKLLRLRPASVLVHLDGGDLAPWIKQNLPGTFVIGRYVWTQSEQDHLLANSSGGYLAAFVLAQKFAGDCDAFVLFNENSGSPVDTERDQHIDDDHLTAWVEFQAWAKRLDEMQVEFDTALRAKGKRGIFPNFGAGIWPKASYYRQHFPLTVAQSPYLGLHTYAWPTLTSGDWHSNFADTMQIVSDFPDKTCILTEIAVTRMYANPGHPDAGWLSSGDGAPLPVAAYGADLRAVHDEMNRHPNLLGGHIFNAAPNETWRTFAVTPELVEIIDSFPEAPVVVTPPPVVPAVVRLRMPFPDANPASHVIQWFGENPRDYNNWGHDGLDFPFPFGKDIFASCAGTVDPIMLSAVYGNYVRIVSTGTLETADGSRRVTGTWQTLYCHLSKVTVKPNQHVEPGDKIGEVGSTGRSTGNHLHFGLRLPGQKSTDAFWGYSDPAPWLGLTKPVIPTKPPTLDEWRVSVDKQIAEIRNRLAVLEAANS